MNVRALVAREANKADFARPLRLQHSLHPSAFGENMVRICVANHFMGIRLIAKVIAAEPNERYLFSAAAQGSIRNAVPGLPSRGLLLSVRKENGCRRNSEELPPGNAAVRGVVRFRNLPETRMTCFLAA